MLTMLISFGCGFRKRYLVNSSSFRFSPATLIIAGSTRVSYTIVFLVAILSPRGCFALDETIMEFSFSVSVQVI